MWALLNGARGLVGPTFGLVADLAGANQLVHRCKWRSRISRTPTKWSSRISRAHIRISRGYPRRRRRLRGRWRGGRRGRFYEICSQLLEVVLADGLQRAVRGRSPPEAREGAGSHSEARKWVVHWSRTRRWRWLPQHSTRGLQYELRLGHLLLYSELPLDLVNGRLAILHRILAVLRPACRHARVRNIAATAPRDMAFIPLNTCCPFFEALAHRIMRRTRPACAGAASHRSQAALLVLNP